MKLLKKLAPLGVASCVVAGIAPTLAACGASGWVDGTVAVDTSNFKKCDKETMALLEDPVDTQDFVRKATKAYLDVASEDPTLVKNDFAYSMNQLCSVVYLMPDYLQIQWGTLLTGLLRDPIERLLEDLPEEISDMLMDLIMTLIQTYAYSPLKSVEVKSFKGKLDNFKIDANDIEKRNFKASYNIDLDLDVKFNLGLEWLPEDLLDIIEYIVGLSLRSFEVELKLRTDTEVHQTPVVAYANMTTQVKTQMLKTINKYKLGNIEKSERLIKYYTGLSLSPYIAQNEDVLRQDKAWYMDIYPELEIIFTNNVGSFSLFAGLPNKIRLDYTTYTNKYGAIVNADPAPQPVVFPSDISSFFIQSLFGWSTYYFSDIIYLSSNPFRGGELWN